LAIFAALRYDCYIESKPVKLLDQLRAAIRIRHLARSTEEAYVHYARDFIRFHKLRHPRDMREPEIRANLAHLAQDRNVAASTQNAALSALLFLYRHVLQIELPFVAEIDWAQKPQHIPAVFTREEVRRILAQLTGTHHLMTSLLYGAGLRLNECLALRTKDIDFAYRQIAVRDGKGFKDRVVPLPQTCIEPLTHQLAAAKALFTADRAAASPAAITPTKARCNARSNARSTPPASTNTPAATLSGTPLPRTCSNAAQISAPCRSCSATKTSRSR
jgi:site-specific recombinase XerD